MKETHLLLVSGYPASGKSIFGDVAKKHGIFSCEFSDCLMRFLRDTDLPINDDLRKVGSEIRKLKGNDAVAKIMKGYLNNEGISRGVLIGCRSPEEIEYLGNFYSVETVAIVVDRKIRYARWINRGKDRDPTSFAECQELDRVETSFGLDKVIGTSDYYIENNDSIYRFRRRISKLLKQVFESEFHESVFSK